MPKEFDLSKPADQAAVVEMIADEYYFYPEITRLLTEAAEQIKAANEWRRELLEAV